MEQVNISVVGAGVIGLAIAAELSKEYSDIVVIEKNSTFGQETSSRNSEVIHAGIYYPGGSLKAKMCVEGKELLYEYCGQNNIGHKRMGKLIVAVDDNEVKELEELYKNGLGNGVADLKILSEGEIKKLEPRVKAIAAIHSPSTGILDTHALMNNFASRAQSRNVQIAYSTELTGVEKQKTGLKVSVKDEREGTFDFLTRVFINAAGLNSDKVARMAGIDKKEYTLKYCKGDYFRVHNNKAKLLSRLVYPVPAKKGVSLGIHTALDLAGSLRLGPDAEYVDKIDYAVDESKKEIFYENTRRFMPFIEPEDLAADMSGIRPKLQGPGEDFRDFLIKEESGNGLPGFVNLIGIDSPGLTCVLSIAKEIKKIVKSIS
ncbi:MAG: NAD(P)/FAD-dependent oxidoreductase [Candidatus Omnitrophota bacterium]